MDQLLTIEILGQPFTFKTDSDIAEARQMADFMVKSVETAKAEFIKNNQPSDNRAILILAALNITNEYFDLRKKHQQLVSDLSQRSEKMIETLNV